MNESVKKAPIIFISLISNLLSPGIGNLIIGKKNGLYLLGVNLIICMLNRIILLNPLTTGIIGLFFYLCENIIRLFSVFYIVISTKHYNINGNVKRTIAKSILLFFMSFIILALLAIFTENVKLFFRTNIQKAQGISMGSKFPNGEIMLIQKNDKYERGDVLSISYDGIEKIENKYKNSFLKPVTMTKRLIAFGGEIVRIKDGTIFVNGEKITEKRIRNNRYINKGEGIYGVELSYYVPMGHIYVLGDNSEKSMDSRYFGAVLEKNIWGKYVKRIWPIDINERFDK